MMDDFDIELIAAWVSGQVGIANPYLLVSVLISFLTPLWHVLRAGYRVICWLAPVPSDLCNAIRDALEDGPVRLDGTGDFLVLAGKVAVDLHTRRIRTEEVDARGVTRVVYADELLSPLDRRRVLHQAALAREKVLARRRRDRKRKAAVMVAAWREDAWREDA